LKDEIGNLASNPADQKAFLAELAKRNHDDHAWLPGIRIHDDGHDNIKVTQVHADKLANGHNRTSEIYKGSYAAAAAPEAAATPEAVRSEAPTFSKPAEPQANATKDAGQVRATETPQGQRVDDPAYDQSIRDLADKFAKGKDTRCLSWNTT
jgi:hypothetical protein